MLVDSSKTTNHSPLIREETYNRYHPKKTQKKTEDIQKTNQIHPPFTHQIHPPTIHQKPMGKPTTACAAPPRRASPGPSPRPRHGPCGAAPAVGGGSTVVMGGY